MIFNLKTSFKVHSPDGLATAILDLHFEGDTETRQALEDAIKKALNPQQEIIEKQPRLGFDTPTGEE